jgi:phosphoribosyl-ATP pyrophosphohydrolase
MEQILSELYEVIKERKAKLPEDSYTVKLLQDHELLFKKLYEELDEIKTAVNTNKREGKDSLTWEMADFIYHLLVLAAANGVELADILKELKVRRSAKTKKRKK